MTTVFKSGQELDPLRQKLAHSSGDCSEFGKVPAGVIPFRRLGGARLPEVGEEELHAFVDGRLDADRRSKVEEVLAHNPQQRRRAEAYLAINADLRALLGVELAPMSAGVSKLSAELQRQMARIARRKRRRALISRIRAVAGSVLAAMVR